MPIPLGFSGFLLAMQAAGYVLDYRDYANRKQLVGMARQMEQSALDVNLEAAQAQAGQESLDEMKQLRENIGNQIVNSAARGGSSFAGVNQSIGTFNRDERTRRLNLLAKQSSLRASGVTSALESLRSETELGRSLRNQILQTLPISSAIDTVGNAFGNSTLGKKWGFGSQQKKKSNFGIGELE